MDLVTHVAFDVEGCGESDLEGTLALFLLEVVHQVLGHGHCLASPHNAHILKALSQ